MTKSHKRSPPLCCCCKGGLWKKSAARQNRGSDVRWLNQSECLQACHLITNTSRGKLTAQCAAPAADWKTQCVSCTAQLDEKTPKGTEIRCQNGFWGRHFVSPVLYVHIMLSVGSDRLLAATMWRQKLSPEVNKVSTDFILNKLYRAWQKLVKWEFCFQRGCIQVINEYRGSLSLHVELCCGDGWICFGDERHKKWINTKI